MQPKTITRNGNGAIVLCVGGSVETDRPARVTLGLHRGGVVIAVCTVQTRPTSEGVAIAPINIACADAAEDIRAGSRVTYEIAVECAVACRVEGEISAAETTAPVAALTQAAPQLATPRRGEA